MIATKAGHRCATPDDRIVDASRGAPAAPAGRLAAPAGHRPRRPLAGARRRRRRAVRGDLSALDRGRLRPGPLRRGVQLLRLAAGARGDLAAGGARARADRREPGASTRCSNGASSVRCCRRAPSWASASCPGRRSGGGVLTGKYRGGMPADSRAAAGARCCRSTSAPARAGIVEAVATAAEGLARSPLAVAWRGCGTVPGWRRPSSAPGRSAAARPRWPPRPSTCRPRSAARSTTSPRRRSTIRRTSADDSGRSRLRRVLRRRPVAGAGQDAGRALAEAGHQRPRRTSRRPNWPGCPRSDPTRAGRLLSSFIGAGPLYEVVRTARPPGSTPAWRAGRSTCSDRRRRGCCARIRGGCWRSPAITPDEADRLARVGDPGVRRDDPRRGRALVDWTLGGQARDGHTVAPGRRSCATRCGPFGVADPTRRGGRRSSPRSRRDRRRMTEVDEPMHRAGALRRRPRTAIAEAIARLVATAEPIGRAAPQRARPATSTTCRRRPWSLRWSAASAC